MKKTFTINISGTVFHIEEDAFEKLQEYLQSLKTFFDTQVGGQEILQDIELRIAELLQEKIAGGQEAVTVEWVDEIMQRMGNPEDFTDQEQAGNAEAAPQTKKAKTKKRLYRDDENRVLGGVCSGMSAYFDIDPVFLRILFVLLIFLGVGVSAIVYLILWIVVPKAQTTTQRLEMRGEEATITNIQKTIQEEASEVKKSFSKINDSEAVRKGKGMINKAGRGLGRLVTAGFGSLFILIGFFGLIGFFTSLVLGNAVFHTSVSGVNPEVSLAGFLGFMANPGLVSLAILLVVLIVGIPLLVILFVGTKLVFRYKTNNKLIGLGAFGVWLLALVVMVAITAGQVSNFSQKNSSTSVKALAGMSYKTLKIELGELPESVVTDENMHIDDFTIIRKNGKNALAGVPTLRIETTAAPDFSVVISKQSRGKNADEIQKTLDNIQYNFASKDSTLVLDRFFVLGDQAKWRRQEVLVTLKVPSGKQVHLGNELDQLHFDFDNVNNIWSKEMVGKTWLMTPEGLTIKE
jgi:phage shock protein PspC (stress-responsive transcriptional regulator)